MTLIKLLSLKTKQKQMNTEIRLGGEEWLMGAGSSQGRVNVEITQNPMRTCMKMSNSTWSYNV